MKRGRHTNPEYKKEDLIQMIVEWTAKGVTRMRQIESIEELGYSAIYAHKLIKEAKPLIDEVLADIGKDLFNQTIAELDRMKLVAEKNKDFALANNIFRERNKIAGLYQERVDITTNGKPIENISVIKLVEILKDEESNNQTNP